MKSKGALTVISAPLFYLSFLFLNFLYLNFGIGLAMAVFFVIAGLGMIFKNDFLAVPRLFQNFCRNMSALHGRCSDLERIPIRNQQHFVKPNCLPAFGDELLHFQFLPGRNPILFTTCFNDCEHAKEM